MTRIYIVRHCETIGNEKKLFQGIIDLDINALGKKQLIALSKRFRDIKLDVVVSSPLKRTMETAKAIAGNRNIPIIVDNEIIELDGGVYEGVPFDDIKNIDPTFPEIWSKRPWELVPPKGEKISEAYDRIWNAVNKIAMKYKEKTIALSTHGGVTRFLLCRILKNDITALNEIAYGENTAVTLLEFDENFKINPVFYNDSSHLTKELKNPNAIVPTK